MPAKPKDPNSKTRRNFFIADDAFAELKRVAQFRDLPMSVVLNEWIREKTGIDRKVPK